MDPNKTLEDLRKFCKKWNRLSNDPDSFNEIILLGDDIVAYFGDLDGWLS